MTHLKTIIVSGFPNDTNITYNFSPSNNRPLDGDYVYE